MKGHHPCLTTAIVLVYLVLAISDANSNEGSTASNTSTTTTTPIITTTPQNFALARVRFQFRITNEIFSKELELPLTERYRLLAERIVSMVFASMAVSFGREKVLTVEVERFWAGSVNTALNVLLETSASSVSGVDPGVISQRVVDSLKRPEEQSSAQLSIDTASILVIDTDLLKPTQPPQITEVSYAYSRIEFSMKAPNEVYNANLSRSSSDAFRLMESNLQQGVNTMLAKRYSENEGWEVVTTLLSAWNDTDKGVWMKFTVAISPQMANTSEIVSELCRNYVYFSRLGTYQIDPSSVTFQDLTNYAPDTGMVVINDEYRQKIQRTKYNGSFVGDYVEKKPRRKAAKVYGKYLIQIAVPAFVGMMLFMAVLLICTTTDSGKEKFYHQL